MGKMECNHVILSVPSTLIKNKLGNPAFTRTWSILIVNPLNLESHNQAKKIPVALPSSPIKLKANGSRGSLIISGQTNKQRSQLYMYRYYLRVIERIECIWKLIGSYFPIFSYKEYYFRFMGRMECIGKLIGSYYPIFSYKEYYFRFMGRMECIGKLIGSNYPIPSSLIKNIISGLWEGWSV